jgi:prevent-host-death family protein
MGKVTRSVPIAELRDDTDSVLRRLRDAQEPLLVTDESGASVVMLSVEAYERAEREREFLRLLVRGEREIAAGEGFDLDAVLAEADELLADSPA